jgi:hypothetical protein
MITTPQYFGEYFMDELELAIAAGLLVIVGLLLMIVKSMLDRGARGSTGGDELATSSTSNNSPAGPGDSAIERPDSEPVQQRPETETERLARIERELSEREKKAKEEKVRELEDRAKFILQRNEKKPAEDPALAKLNAEKEKIRLLIKRAEESYEVGELEEKNFKRIVSDYQQQLIDFDIKIKKLKNPK